MSVWRASRTPDQGWRATARVAAACSSDGNVAPCFAAKNDREPRPARVTVARIAAHAPPIDHVGRDLRRLFEVIRRAGRDLLEEQLLSRAAAHQGDESRAQVRLCRQIVVLLRADGHAQRLAVGEERDLLDPAHVVWTLPQIAWPTS